MAIFRWAKDPWWELRRLRDEVESAFGRAGRFFGRSDGSRPPVNVYQNDEGLTVTAELPGVKGDVLSVETEGDILRISARREAPEGVEDRSYHRSERTFGDLSRELRLPAGLDTEKIEASLTDGVLTVRLPRAESAKPRKIAVKAG
jgi:HSP20 family protein